MSTLKNQESTSDEELTHFRRLAVDKDVLNATLESELLKKNNDLAAMKSLLNETLNKLRMEADRALQFESELNRRSEDLRSERLTRQNLEASLTATKDKLTAEEQTAKHLQMELESYASRTSYEHGSELKRLQQEKAALESRLRGLEAQQAQTNKPSQLPTRVLRPRAYSGATTTAPEARVATLEAKLSKAERDLDDTTRALHLTKQEAAKVPRLQSELIAAENARLRAENSAKTERLDAEATRESLKEQEEELEYWRTAANRRSVDESRMEDALRERDEALLTAQESRSRETSLRKRLEEMEEKEAELVMAREEALNELHELQAKVPLDSNPQDVATIAELRKIVAEKESTLISSRGFATELQQMYRDTLSACEDAEARVKDLENQLQQSKADPPLVIVSPPPSPLAPAQILVQPQPRSRLSPEDEAIVGKLLTAVERLRGERDALRRDLHFAKIERRVTEDSLRAGLGAAETQLRILESDNLIANQRLEDASVGTIEEIRRLYDEAELWRRKYEGLDSEAASRATDLATCQIEVETMRARVQGIEENTMDMVASQKRSSQMALASLVLLQHMNSELDEAIASRSELAVTNQESLQDRDELIRMRDEAIRRRDQLAEACTQTEEKLVSALQSHEETCQVRDALHEELAVKQSLLDAAVKEVEQRDTQMAKMRSKLEDLSAQIHALEDQLLDAREELIAVESSHAAQHLSVLTPEDSDSAVKAQLEVLEQRILKRTEQISMMQHDTKRLEENLRVSEETVEELRAEMGTLQLERACLVEDCAQAREARDEALKNIEHLELEIETLTQPHQVVEETEAALHDAREEIVANGASIEAMVHVIMSAMAQARTLQAVLRRNNDRLTTFAADSKLADSRHSEALAEIQELTSKIELTTSELRTKTAGIDQLTKELAEAKDETQRLSDALNESEKEREVLEQDIDDRAQDLTATIEELESQLATAQLSEESLSQDLEAAGVREEEIRVRLEQVQEESKKSIEEVESLSSSVATLERELEQERSSHTQAITSVQEHLKAEIATLEAQLEDSKSRLTTVQMEHSKIVEEFKSELESVNSRLADASTRESFENDLRRLKVEHTEELTVLRSQLEESNTEVESLRVQLQVATDAITDLESEIHTMAGRFDAAQVEIRGLEHALVGARAQLDEYDVSVNALQRERNFLQMEHTRLEAELDKISTKYQYVEQQAKRSDYDVVRLKSEVERLRAQATKSDEAAQTAEIGLSFKTTQYEQKLAMLQRELEKRQGHRQCQENIAELNEKNEYLEEVLRMKSIEIEENDDRFIDALKEKKRLTSKVESLTRKVQILQTKLAAQTPVISTPPVSALRPKTPTATVQAIPAAGPSSRPTSRIPSSPAMALRSKTPEPLRRNFRSTSDTPEPSVPPFLYPVPKPSDYTFASRPDPNVASQSIRGAPSTLISHTNPVAQAAPSTPISSGNRKRRAPDDFDTPVRLPAQPMVVPGVNTTPRHLRRPTDEGKTGFTPIRVGPAAAPARPQASPLRRTTAPFTESTNSPRGKPSIGLGKPAAAPKQAMRSWLSRTRTPTLGGEMRVTSIHDSRQ